MPLKGGPANKLGNRYETWWTVSQLVRMLRGDADEIRIEDLGFEKAEFVVKAGSCRELHQVKRSHPNGKWSLAGLSADGLLQAIGQQLAGNNDRFVFASGSDAPELSELCEAAKCAESVEEFKPAFLATNERKKWLKRLRCHWKCEVPDAVDQLRRVEIHTIDERELVDKVQFAVQALFLANPNRVMDKLRGIVEDSVHRTLRRQTLVHELDQLGYQLRRVRSPLHAGDAIEAATNQYLDGARSKLIRRKLVRRKAANTLLSRLDGKASDNVVTGRAGSGKTACVVQVTECLHARGIPVVAFRMDRFLSASTTTDLGEFLALEESPVLVLAAAAETVGHPGVLIVDQLDAVSSLSGRKSEAFDLVEQLLREARGARPRANIHTVVVCRAFDWKNDSRLRRLMPDSHAQVDVIEFTVEEVTTILGDAGFDPRLFGKRQLELLRLPQNLSLFLDADFNASRAPTFGTATKLFDQYWDTKRQVVEEQVENDLWMEVMKTLCDEMTSTQQLSVAKERLDIIQPNYLHSLASEGVLSFDGRRYGFGHESFFDYCFARLYFTRSDSLVSFLKKSEQHLFCRALVRQALVYLRDVDFDRYVREIDSLLSDEAIRPHIKHLVLALLAEVTEPTEQEWTIWVRWSAPSLEAIESGTPNTDKLSALAWRRFYGSSSWFGFDGTQKRIKEWLASGNDCLVDEAVDYLKVHHRHSPDVVAVLLKPYADCGGGWPPRLRYLMDWADHHASRRFFGLFLRLVDNGVLDKVCVPDGANSTFWSRLRDLGENRPEWIPEVLAHRLRRRFAVILDSGKDLRQAELLGYDDFATELFEKSATRAPAAYVEHVLPVVLEISDSARMGDEPPKLDGVWSILIETDHPDGKNACLSQLAMALVALARERNTDLSSEIAELRRRDTHIANHLLLALYGGGAARYADEAVLLLCDEPWRFQCGFSGNRYWCAMEAIRALFPHCSAGNRNKLQAAILRYADPYERTIEGRRENGRARFNLLSAIPKRLRSTPTNVHFEELKRKFGEPEGKPRKITAGFVKSPIERSAAERMTDCQWLRAIAKYSTNRPDDTADPIKGGAPELARILEERAKEEPVRFARLSLRFPADANPVYLDRILAALRESTVDSALKLQVCRKAFQESPGHCGKSIADVLGNLGEALPNQAVQMLHHLATEHDDPDRELWRREVSNGEPFYGGDIYMNGMNTTRGRAANAISDLILRNAAYIDRFRPTLEMIMRDRSASVLSCAARTLRAVAYIDPALGQLLFQGMNLSEDRLLTTRHVYAFIRGSLRDNFAEMQPILERMLRSPVPEVCEAGAHLVSVAALIHESAADATKLANEASHGDIPARRGVAQIAAANIATSDCRGWCEETLNTLFNDDNADVRRIASSSFSNLEHENLDTYGHLIDSFCESRAFAKGSYWLVRALENSLGRLPGVTCSVCERLLNHCPENTHTVAKLIFWTYQQHQDEEWGLRALDLIDRLCLEGLGDIGSEFGEFDR